MTIDIEGLKRAEYLARLEPTPMWPIDNGPARVTVRGGEAVLFDGYVPEWYAERVMEEAERSGMKRTPPPPRAADPGDGGPK